MSLPHYQTRRIFRSHVTSQDVVRELLQIMFLAELLAPSREVWSLGQRFYPARQPQWPLQCDKSSLAAPGDSPR